MKRAARGLASELAKLAIPADPAAEAAATWGAQVTLRRLPQPRPVR